MAGVQPTINAEHSLTLSVPGETRGNLNGSPQTLGVPDARENSSNYPHLSNGSRHLDEDLSNNSIKPDTNPKLRKSDDKNQDEPKIRNRNEGIRKVSRGRPSMVQPQPPDGGWGWVVVFAAFISCAGVVGLTRAFGIIYVEILHAFPGSSALAASWIPGIYNTLSTGLAPVAGALSNRFSCRSVVFVGGILMSIGLMLNYFATSVEYLYVTFGVITGCGAGMCTTPGIIMVARYFKKRRALANGLCLAGTSSGAFVQPIIVEYLTEQFGFRGAMLIMGGIMLHISAFSFVYRPLEAPKPPDLASRPLHRKKQRAKKYFQFLSCFFDRKSCRRGKTQSITDVPLPGEGVSMLPSKTNPVELVPKSSGAVPPVVITRICDDREMQEVVFDEMEDDTESYEGEREIHRSRSICLDHSVNDLHTVSAAQYQDSIRRKKSSVGTRQPMKPPVTGFRRYLDLMLFKNRAFVLFVTSSAFTSVGYPHASVFMPAFATSKLGIARSDTGLLLSITAGADLVGRIGFGYLSDLGFFKRIHGYMFNVAMVAMATLTLPYMKNYTDLIIHSLFYGLGVGSFFMLTPVILTDHHGPEKVASSYGLLRLFHGVMSIITPPIAGVLRDSTGEYTYGFLMMGTVMMLGSLIMFFMPMALRYEDRKEARRRSSVGDPLHRPSVIDLKPEPMKQRRASLESWGRRFSVEPDHEP